MYKIRYFLFFSLCALQPIASYAMQDFTSYLWNEFTSDSLAAQEEPLGQPETVPCAQEVGALFAKNLEQKKYESPFLFGASTSEHQCSKKCMASNCSWERFAQEKNLARPTDTAYPIDLWTHYRSYIDFAKDKLGLNALRFSIEWALVQPEGPTSCDQEVLAHYADMFAYCIRKRITPIVCFHHYTDPCWFIDAGGFEKEENKHYFVNFCNTVYHTLINRLQTDHEACAQLKHIAQPLFATFNSPEGYAFKGYHQLKAPPADPNKKGLRIVVTVLKNMMEAHVLVYYTLKQKYAAMSKELKASILSPQIGFLKNIIQLDPAHNTITQRCLSGLTRIACAVGNSIQNESIYTFFKTGEFKVYLPTQFLISHTNKAAIGALDFIGINYYSNRLMFLGSSVPETDEQFQTDNTNYRFYHQGLYRAIVEVDEKLAAPLGIPMYVTENGIATQDDAKRNAFYCQYLYTLARAIEDGHDVRGYLTWTLADNYEWPNLEDNQRRVYGLCSLEKNNPEQLVLKNGAQAYIDIVKFASGY